MLVDLNSLSDVIQKLSKAQELGLDTETTGLQWKDRLFSIIISDADDSYYFSYQEYPHEEALLPRSTIWELREIFSNPHSTFFIHNAKFDWNMLYKEGLEIKGRVWCTYAIERVIRNNYFPESLYSLDDCSQRNLGLSKADDVEKYIEKHKLFTRVSIPGKKRIEKHPHFDKVPLDIISKYAKQDAKLHRTLGMWQQKELERLEKIYPARGPLPAITNIANNEVRLTRTCAKMERLGVKVDVDYIKEAIAYETSQQENLKRTFKNLTGMDFQDGPKLLTEAFKKRGLTPGVTTKGNASFTADILEGMNDELSATINSIRKIEKRIGTYYSSFLYCKDDKDIIHPNLKQCGTVTGRFSCTNPNLQNVPKEENENEYHIRGCFVPREGHTFISIDYAQQELRLLLDYAGEKELIAQINSGMDCHQAMADMVGIPRKTAKTLTFALLYGAGVAKIAAQLGITEDEAFKLKKEYFGKLPGVRKFVNMVPRVAKQRGFICNAFGRVCHVDDPDFAFTAVNHLIQGTGGDAIKFAMNRIDEELPEVRMVLQIHDELLLEVLPDQFDLIPKVQSIMENVYTSRNGVILKTSVAHSAKSWASKDMKEGSPNAG